MDQESDVRTSTRGRPLPRRSLIRWLLGFSVVSTLGGVLTPVVGYLWPPARARSSEGGRTLVGAVSDFPLNSGTTMSRSSSSTPRLEASRLTRPSAPICPASSTGTKCAR
jgi:hypothetical protein